jgi:hypothetical protein
MPVTATTPSAMRWRAAPLQADDHDHMDARSAPSFRIDEDFLWIKNDAVLTVSAAIRKFGWRISLDASLALQLFASVGLAANC